MKIRSLYLWPILVFFVLLILICDKYISFPDEARYLYYAQNLTQGFYAPRDTLLLWGGPGYPLLLAAFMLMGIPMIAVKLLNGLFLFLACYLVFLTLRYFVSEKLSLWGAYLLAAYLPLYPHLPALLTEPLAVFLTAGGVFFMVKCLKSKSLGYMVLAAVALGYLALTRVFFGYVILAGLVLSGLSLKWSFTGRRTFPICLLALVFCLPYLYYTYRLTGRYFYWANSGGQALYGMTTPYPQEYGDWEGTEKVLHSESWHRHHELYQRLAQLNYVDSDAAFKKAALENIRRHPGKYLYNWLANLGRMWFEYPWSYKYQRPHTLFYMVPNAILLTCLVLCGFPLWNKRKQIPGLIKALIIFAAIYVLGSSLIGTCTRYLQPIVPIFIITIVFTFGNILEIKFRHSDSIIAAALNTGD